MRGNKKKSTMSLVGHLREIRDRLAISVLVLIVAFIACFALIRHLADAMLAMGSQYGFQYVYLAPSELLTSYFKLALILAVVIVSPFLVFELWRFVSPALRAMERKAILPALFGGFLFFLLGGLFAYFIAIPFMIQFLVDYSQSAWVNASISVASYIDFLIGMILVFGIVFEMPMLAYVLSRLGVLSPKLMRRVRRYVIPACFLLATIITPPDVASQFMVAIPMLGLYEISILISMAVQHRRQQEDDEEEEGQALLKRLWDDSEEDDQTEGKSKVPTTTPAPAPVEDDEELFYG